MLTFSWIQNSLCYEYQKRIQPTLTLPGWFLLFRHQWYENVWRWSNFLHTWRKESWGQERQDINWLERKSGRISTALWEVRYQKDIRLANLKIYADFIVASKFQKLSNKRFHSILRALFDASGGSQHFLGWSILLWLLLLLPFLILQGLL